MFWTIYLAHLVADYPLQTDKMVMLKRSWRGLLLHVFVHLLTMLLLVGTLRENFWLPILVLTAIHYLIDTLKNAISRAKPDWIAGSYIIDQVLHLLSVLAVASWIDRVFMPGTTELSTLMPLMLAGLLVATYVWYISERILSMNQSAYQAEMVAQRWPRMLTRGLIYVLVVISFSGGTSALLGGLLLPYFSGKFRSRALIVDGLVAFVVAGIVLSFM